MEQLQALGMKGIDIVICNLYDFQQAARTGKDVLEHIDIGGVALLRAAAKNHRHVAVLSSPEQYGRFVDEMEKGDGELTEQFLHELAVSAFELTASYDSLISSYLGGAERLGNELLLNARKKMNLRYGENPEQRAAVYRKATDGLSITDAKLHQGKELSYNNILDLSIALEIIMQFEAPCAVVIKHSNPVGVATAETLEEAMRLAYECDPVSAYGCVIGLNRELGEDVAQYLKEKFVEAIIAPSVSDGAMMEMKKRKNLRLLTLDMKEGQTNEIDVRRIVGGYLAQTNYIPPLDKGRLRTVTVTRPTQEQIESMLFAWKIVRYVWSNAIVIAKGNTTVGIGGGQTSRVEAVRLAVSKSLGRSNGAVLASDAFFPFRDGIDEAAKGGIAAIIQPGGSIRDSEVIQAADEHGIAMLFTGQRLFRH